MMAIGTSDGKVFEDEFEYAVGQLDTMHVETYGPAEGAPSWGHETTRQASESAFYHDRIAGISNAPYQNQNAMPEHPFLDTMRPGEVYDDTQTDQEYDRRLMQWGRGYTDSTGRKFDNPNFEDRMIEYTPGYSDALDLAKKGEAYDTGELPPVPSHRISYTEPLLNKPMNEPFVGPKEKENAWKLLMRHVFNEPEIAAMEIKKGVSLWAKKTVDTLVKAIQAPGDAAMGNLDPSSPEATKRATDLAALVIGGPVPIVSRAVDGTLGSIAGISAKTASTEKLNLANMLELRGATPEHIWDKTGYFRGIDDKWRFELPNSDLAVFRNPRYEEVGSIRKYEASPVTEVFDYPELFAAYPSLKKYTVKIDNTIPELGLHRAGDKLITLNLDMIKSSGQYTPETVLLHELQHAIQTKEKFVMGRGGEENQLDVLSRAIMSKIDSIKNPAEAAELAMKIKDTLIRSKEMYGDKIGQEMYRRDPAEQEANTVMARSRWTQEDRNTESPRVTLERDIRTGHTPIPVVTPNEALWAK